MASRFSERQRSIIAHVASSASPVTGQAIANLLGCSLRTVQGEISRINRTRRVITSSNRGYTLDREAARKLDEGVASIPHVSISHGALQALLLDGGKHRVDDLSEALFVSTPTLERHLKTLARTLEAHNLELLRKGGWLWISGDEADKRRLIAALVAEEANGSLLDTARASSLFGDMDIELVTSLVTSVVEALGYRIKPGYKDNLLASIVIALYRMRMNASVPGDDEEGRRSYDELAIAQEICRRYAEHFTISPSSNDIVYLAHLLRGQVEPRDAGHAAKPTAWSTELVEVIEGIVNEVLETFQLHAASPQALYNFAMHVDALLYRSMAEQVRNDDVLDTVKRRLPFVYEIALLVADRIAKRFGIDISSGEVGFICIHMGLLLESALDEERIRVALVCHEYRGIAANIRAGVLERFSDMVTLSEATAEEVTANGNAFDLAITTQHLPDSTVRTVEVSPFLIASDLLLIEGAIGACVREKHAARTRALLSTFLDERLFFKTDDLDTKRDAIVFLGGKLHENGIVDESFIESVLKREKLSSTCFFNLFAIPHAIELNAKRTMLAVALSDRGVLWDGVRIHAVLMIAVQRADRHRFKEIYDNVIKALWNEERIARIVRAATLEEFIDSLTAS